MPRHARASLHAAEGRRLPASAARAPEGGTGSGGTGSGPRGCGTGSGGRGRSVRACGGPMHWSDQAAGTLGVRGHPVASYNGVYYARTGDGSPAYENGSGQLLFRHERSSSPPFRWVLSFSSAPDNLEEPATWCACPLLCATRTARFRWFEWSSVLAATPQMMGRYR